MSRHAEDLLGAVAELAGRIRLEDPAGPDENADPSTPLLLAGVRSLDNATSLSAILGTLVRIASSRESDARVFLAGDGAPREWRHARAAPINTSGAAGPAEATGTMDDSGLTALAARSADTAAIVAASGYLAFPLQISGHVVAVLCVRDTTEQQGGETRDARRARLELLTRHAARCLEVVTAFKTARFVTRQNDPLGTRSGDDEQSARRYARLLVSEIKLYHQPSIAEGQRRRDLVSRLGGEIARAQALYDERVPASVRHTTDYFRDELVRTLADGDASLFAAWRPARTSQALRREP